MTTFSFQRVGLTAVVVATLVGGLSACAPLAVGGMATGLIVATDRRTSGIQLEDEGIELRAANRLRDTLGDRGHLNVTSFNRQVLLTGEVPTDQDKANIERVVGQVENVRLVLNEVAVMGNTTFSQRSNDTLVTGRVKAAVVDARDLTVNAFKFVTERGVVYIMGRVTQREANRVTDVVRSVQSVQRVVRALEVISEEELARLQPKPAPKKDEPAPAN
jgi:osmotically-inducible protein OsmY